MILVTGATGLLGSHLLLHLIAHLPQNTAIRATFRSQKRIDSNPILNQLPKNRIEWIEADVLDVFALQKVFENITHVYHAAAMVSFDPKDAQKMLRTNITGTANVVELCQQHHARLVHVSSIAALGNAQNEGKPIDEQNTWKDDEHNASYAQSKFHSEMEVWRGIEEGLNAAVVNPSVILGEGNWGDWSGQLVATVWKGMPFYTSGATGYVDVKDVAKCMVLVMDSGVVDQRFILNAVNLPLRTVFDAIALGLNKKPSSIYLPWWLSNIGWRVLALMGKLTGKRAFITKELVYSAYEKAQYSNDKLKKQFSDFEFQDIDVSIKRICKSFLSTVNQ